MKNEIVPDNDVNEEMEIIVAIIVIIIITHG